VRQTTARGSSSAHALLRALAERLTEQHALLA